MGCILDVESSEGADGRGEWEVFRELVLEHNDVADDHVERKNRYVGFPAFVAWYRSQLMAHQGE